MQRLSPDRAQDPPLRALFPNKALSLPPSPCLRVSLSLSLSCWTYHELVEKTRSAYDHIILKAESLRQVETVQAVFAEHRGNSPGDAEAMMFLMDCCRIGLEITEEGLRAVMALGSTRIKVVNSITLA